MGKRKLADNEKIESGTSKRAKQNGTPAKLLQKLDQSDITATPTHPRSILKVTPSRPDTTPGAQSIQSTGRVLFTAQTKAATVEDSPSTKAKVARNDASARKKSALVLQRQAATDPNDGSDVEDELDLAREILSDDDPDETGDADGEPIAEVPVKRGRGRPKGSKRARTPTPPPDMPAQEMYFFRNRTHASKTSSNMLPAHLLLNHEDYLAQIKAYDDPHSSDIKRLKQLHTRSFEQWQFELEENFSICLYGFGSKRELVLHFARYLHDGTSKAPKIVMVNGYISTLAMKDILSLLATQVLPKSVKPPLQINALFEAVMKALDKHSSRIYLVIHNLDSGSLRKPAAQAMLARLTSHKNISLIASCDNLNFGLVWDLNLLRQYNFVFHDATTFEPWTVELDSVEEVNLLLGRSSRRLTGKDGVGYVLRSLPENARNLFKILVTEQLTLDLEYDPNANQPEDDDEDMLGASDEELAAMQETPSRKGRGRAKKSKEPKTKQNPAAEGIEYRALYHKAVEEFVCSSEVNFRTLLKEFHDHQMIESRKDPMGTERLIIPFRREELEAILEEL